MIHHLPHMDWNAPIKCQLFNYDLSERSNHSHIHELLLIFWADYCCLTVVMGSKVCVTFITIKLVLTKSPDFHEACVILHPADHLEYEIDIAGIQFDVTQSAYIHHV